MRVKGSNIICFKLLLWPIVTAYWYCTCILSVQVARSSHILLLLHLYLDINKLNVAKSFKSVIIHLFPGALFSSFYNRIQSYAVDDKSVRQWKATSLNKRNNHKSIIVYHK